MHFILDIFASMRQQFLIFVALFCSQSLFAQFSFNINGIVKDKRTGEALMGVKVDIKDWHVESYTNRYGFFSISSPPQDIVFEVSYEGYVPYRDSLYIEDDRTFLIELEQVEVSDYEESNPPRNQNEVTDVLGNRIDLPIKFARKIPYMLGETDLIKGLQTLPGVKFGNEGFSNLFVRGGGADQNLFLLDGIPMYYSNHLFGLVSIYNPEAINNVQLHKGGFASRYGGRLSSVVDMTTNEGSTEDVHGSASLTPLAFKLSTSGGFGNKKTTYAVSLRRSYFDLMIQPFLLSSGNQFGLFYSDLNVKLTHTLSKNDKIYFTYFLGRDVFRQAFSETDSTLNKTAYDLKSAWNNQTSSLRWNHVFNKKLFSSTALMFSRYIKVENLSEELSNGGQPKGTTALEYLTGINDVLLHSDFELNQHNDHFIRFGLQTSIRNFNTGYIEESGKDFPNAPDYSNVFGNKAWSPTSEIALYVEDDYRLNINWKFNYGLRLVSYLYDGKLTYAPEPRVSARYLVNDNLSIKASYARMNQFLHLITTAGASALNSFWAPATSNVGPQNSDQITAGFVQSFKTGHQLLVDAYWKQMNNLVVISSSNQAFNVRNNWESAVDQGKGISYGLEILLKKNYGKTTSWYGYTLSSSTRQFELLNGGEAFPFNYDRRHQFNALLQFWISDITSISTNWVLGSGNPFTLPVGKYYDIDGREVLDYGKLNNFRAGRYARLDIGFNRNYGKITDKVTQELNISIYNFFFRKNPSLVYAVQEEDPTGNLVYRAYQDSYFVFLPGVHYILRF